MMEQLLSPPWSLLFSVYAESIGIAQAATSTPTCCPKSYKFNSNVEMLFHLEVSEDNGGILIIENTIHHMFDCIGMDWIWLVWNVNGIEFGILIKPKNWGHCFALLFYYHN